MTRLLFAFLVLAATSPVVLAQTKADPVPAPMPTDAGANVYRQVLQSTVWIHSDRGNGKFATGSSSARGQGPPARSHELPRCR
ncbi:MAG: hypothetical protein U0792_25245 [Gemmataceae bacterium]